MKMDLEAAVQRNLDDIVEKARDWALLNGLTMRPKSKLEAGLRFLFFFFLRMYRGCVRDDVI